MCILSLALKRRSFFQAFNSPLQSLNLFATLRFTDPSKEPLHVSMIFCFTPGWNKIFLSKQNSPAYIAWKTCIFNKTCMWSEPRLSKNFWLEAGNACSHALLPKALSKQHWMHFRHLSSAHGNLIPNDSNSFIPQAESISPKCLKEDFGLSGPLIFSSLSRISLKTPIKHHFSLLLTSNLLILSHTMFSPLTPVLSYIQERDY